MEWIAIVIYVVGILATHFLLCKSGWSGRDAELLGVVWPIIVVAAIVLIPIRLVASLFYTR
jgi:hypothetical protein